MIQYAQADDGTHLAYRVLDADTGDHPGTDVVMVSGGLFPIEVFEEDPGFARLLAGLRTIGRVVIFDRRGIGLSDPISDWQRPVLAQWADDVAAVVTASGVSDPVVFAWDFYGVAPRFAALHPDKLRLLALFQPFSLPDDEWDAWIGRQIELLNDNVAGRRDDLVGLLAPSRSDDATFREWYLRAGRVGASPSTAGRIWESVYGLRPFDQLLESIQTPTLVLQHRDMTYVPPQGARFVAEQIAGAVYVEVPGADFFPFLGDVDAVVAEVAAFVTGERRLPPPERLLAAVMFTDLVGSTQLAAGLGDARWKSVLDRHDSAVRAAVGRAGGSVVKTTGDGVLALLPSAGASVRAAVQVREQLRADGLSVRIGIHVGDVDRRGDDVSGLAVNIAARAMSNAGDGEVVVTGSVPIAAGASVGNFEPLGAHELKGVPGTWDLYRFI